MTMRFLTLLQRYDVILYLVYTMQNLGLTDKTSPNYISILDKIFLIYLRFKFNLESCIFILKFNNPNQREFHASLYFLSIQITCNRSTGNSIIAELRLSDVVAVV